MRLLLYIRLRINLLYLRGVEKKFDKTMTKVSEQKLNRINESLNFVNQSIKRFQSLYSDVYKTWATQFEEKITKRNELIKDRLELANRFIESVEQFKKNPQSMSYLVFIKQYSDFIEVLKTTKYGDVTLKTALKSYQQISSFHAIWTRDYNAFQGLVGASQIIDEMKDMFITGDTYRRLLSYQTHINHIKKMGTDFSYQTAPYERALLFFTDIAAYAVAQNAKFIYKHLYQYYHDHKQDTDFKLENHIQYLFNTHQMDHMDLKLYFDGAQNQNMTAFEIRIITQVLSRHKEAKFIQNLYIKDGDKKIKMDLVLFIKGHIYLLNCHDYKGSITGLAITDTWQNTFLTTPKDQDQNFDKSSSLNFPNPLKENLKHIELLKQIYPFEYEGFALFNDEAEIKTTGRGTYLEREFLLYLDNIEDKKMDTRLAYYTLMLENIVE